MVKKRLDKLIVLLVVLIVASLVVDLVSLNVLYSISKGSGLKGKLATTSPSYSSDDESSTSGYWEDGELKQFPSDEEGYYGDYYEGGYNEIIDNCKEEVEEEYDSCMEHCEGIFPSDFEEGERVGSYSIPAGYGPCIEYCEGKKTFGEEKCECILEPSFKIDSCECVFDAEITRVENDYACYQDFFDDEDDIDYCQQGAEEQLDEERDNCED